jgi:hypothetical protein
LKEQSNQSNPIEPIQSNPIQSNPMTFDFVKEQALLKSKGYMLIDYTNKVKRYKDFSDIREKMKTTNDGKFIYKKMIMMIRMVEVCKKIKGLKEHMLKDGANPDGITLIHTKNYLAIDANKGLSPIVWEAFLNRKDEELCEVCCVMTESDEMMPCSNCVYPCCRKCFLKKVNMSLAEGEIDGRCFGCRENLIIDVIYEKD